MRLWIGDEDLWIVHEEETSLGYVHTPQHSFPRAPESTSRFSALTPREREVLELVALGFTNREIGQKLGISPHTVKTHTDRIYGKLDVTSRCQASVWATRMGLV